MRNYFELQYKIINRNLLDLGLQPLVTCLAAILVFVALSVGLFIKTPFAVFIYPGIALVLVLKLSEGRRNNFLKNLFTANHFYTLRIIENLLIVLPFLLFLIYKYYFKTSLLLALLSTALVFFDNLKSINLTIPTPFYKKPFEFIVGFRKSIVYLLLLYLLTIIAIRYQNFNLAMFSLILIFGICFSFYTQPEIKFFVWIYRYDASAFLLNKIKIGLYFSSLLCLPSAILLIIFFPANLFLILALQMLGYIYLSTIILAKYSAYPENINLPQGLLLIVSLLFPPLLLGVIPFFYFQSTKRLKEILV